LRATERIGVENERTQLFAQFQDEYRAVSSQFPARHHEPNFKPTPGSDDFARLERYWFFVFSEWYETNRVNPRAFGDLWRNYYTPLVADALELQSLRFVLEQRITVTAGITVTGDYGDSALNSGITVTGITVTVHSIRE
jgi:hypothetical protein